MKQVGSRRPQEISEHASGEFLMAGARFNESLTRLSGLDRVGLIPKGLYRFKTHEEANRQDGECLAQAMARLAEVRERQRATS